MSNWLDSVPVSDKAYVFQASLICEDCGASIEATASEDDGDTDNFPQGPYPQGGGEADSAQFCAQGAKCVNTFKVAGHKIGCPLKNPLTADGVTAVVESILNNMFSRPKYGRMIGRLLKKVWADDCVGVVYPERIKPRYAGDLPDSLIRCCKSHHSKQHLHNTATEGFRDFTYADLEYAYLMYEHAGVVDLCRSRVDDDGEFQELEITSMPLQVAKGRDPRELFVSAIDAGAWD